MARSIPNVGTSYCNIALTVQQQVGLSKYNLRTLNGITKEAGSMEIH